MRQAPMEAAVLKAVRNALTPAEIAPWLDAVMALHRERWGQRDAIKARVERDLADVTRRIGHLVEAIAKGDAPEPLIASLKSEQARKVALEAEQATLEAPGGPILPVRAGSSWAGSWQAGTAKMWVLERARLLQGPTRPHRGRPGAPAGTQRQALGSAAAWCCGRCWPGRR